MTSRSLVGATVGNYQIIRRLAEGGMGVVYLAMHSILGRSAAIKVLLPELSRNRDIVGRLFNEARAEAAIRHRSSLASSCSSPDDGRASARARGSSR
jgi:serine/threonine protein kinase